MIPFSVSLLLPKLGLGSLLEVILLLVLLAIGLIVIIIIAKVLLFFLPAAIVAAVVYFLAYSRTEEPLFWAGVAFLVVAFLSILKRK